MESGFAEGYAVGKDSSNNNGGFGFGGYGEWIWIIVLFALWQNGGWGFGGAGGGGAMNGYVLATDFATLERKMDGINAGLCDGFYAMNTGMLNGFNGVQQTLCQGFSGINQNINNIGYSIKDCCCTTQRAIDGVNYNLATQFGALNNTLCNLGRDIIENQNANYRALHDENVAMRIEAKDEKIADLQNKLYRADLSASQAKQSNYITDTILNKLSPCPSPAFIVPNPNCCYNYNVQGVGYANSGCGCC